MPPCAWLRTPDYFINCTDQRPAGKVREFSRNFEISIITAATPVRPAPSVRQAKGGLERVGFTLEPEIQGVGNAKQSGVVGGQRDQEPEIRGNIAQFGRPDFSK
jgi:hypothetical protein